MKFNTEKRTKILLGILGIIVAIMYILVSWGKAEWTAWAGLISSGFLALFLYSEGAILEYFRKKDYKKITFSDIICWTTFIVATLMLASFLLLIQVISNSAPQWLSSFIAGYGTIIGSLAGILFLYHMFAKRPR